jgi:hypothetical protein
MLTALDLTEERFGLDTEVTALLLRNGVRPFEVPVSYYSRSHAEGKKIRTHDALVCAWVLVKVRLRRLRAQAAAFPEPPSPHPDGLAGAATLRPVELSESPGEIAAGKAS